MHRKHKTYDGNGSRQKAQILYKHFHEATDGEDSSVAPQPDFAVSEVDRKAWKSIPPHNLGDTK